MKSSTTDYLLLLLLALIWSTSFLLIKIGVDSIGPATLTAGRMVVAAGILVVYLAIGKRGLPLYWRAMLLYGVVGFIGHTLPFILLSWGQTHIDSSLAAILIGVMPITTFVLAHYFLPDEPMTARKVLGICLGFGGVLTVVGWSALAGVGEHALGQLAVLGTAVCYGVNAVFVRSQPAFPRLQMAAGAMLVGAATSVPLAFLLENPLAMTPSAAGLGALVLLGIFPTTLAILIFFRLLHNLGTTTTSQLYYAIPVLGSIWGVALLGELLEARALAALALVLGGLYFVQSKAKSKTANE